MRIWSELLSALELRTRNDHMLALKSYFALHFGSKDGQ